MVQRGQRRGRLGIQPGVVLNETTITDGEVLMVTS
jgi:hypothetical protein